jgi:PAS domain S-box-containing protein
VSGDSHEEERLATRRGTDTALRPGRDGASAEPRDPPSPPDVERLRTEAAHALRQGRFGPAERLLADGRLSVEALVHDLRVHQVELEMQADELRNVNGRLEDALAQFRELFELLPHAAFVTDRSGAIVEANDLGRRSLDALGRARVPEPALRHLGADPETRARLSTLFGEIARHGIARVDRCPVLGPGGAERIVDAQGRRLGGGPRDRFLVLFLDRTEQERATRSHAGLFDNATDGMILLHADARVYRMNHAAQRLLVRPGQAHPPEVPFEHFLEESSRSAFREALVPLQHAFPGERNRAPLQLRAKRPDGGSVPIELSLSLSDASSGEVLLIVRDVSEREDALAAHRESENRFRQVTGTMSEVFWLRDPDVGRWLYVSPGFETLFGLRVSDLMVNPELWVRAVHPEDRPALRAHQAATGAPSEIEYRVVRPDGEVRWVRDRCAPVRSGAPGEHRLAGTAADVTESLGDRRRAALLQSAVDELDEIVLVAELATDPEAPPTIAFVNAAFERITGYGADEAVGRPLPFLRGHATDPQESARLDAAIRDRRPTVVELQVHRKGGQPIWIETHASPVFDAGGHGTHMVAVLRDVTERRREAERRQRAQRLEAVGLLTGGIAHDFNNLLTVIQGHAEMLRFSAGVDGTSIAPIAEAASRGADLTRRLLAFAGRQPLAPRLVELDDTVRHTLRLLERTLGPRIEIERTLASRDARVRVDVGAFENAMVNLCLNARDAMPDGGRLVIRTGIAPATEAETDGAVDGPVEERVTIEIVDQGHGIAEDVLPRIFDPFFTTKAAGNGTGLGLAMVHTFVNQAGGTVEVDSEPGRGTCFRIQLPAHAPAEREPRADEAAVIPEGDGRLVLVVEDDPGVRNFVVACLESFGYRTLACERFEEAMELEQAHPELACLLSDVMLRGPRTGRELAEAFSRDRPELPVVLMTGYDPDAAPAEHVAAVLHKPFDRELLGRTLGSVLEAAAGA